MFETHPPTCGAKFRPPATSVRRRRTCEVRPESSVEKPAKNVQEKSKCFGGDAHQLRRSARRAERSAVLGVHGPRLGAKFRPPATSVRRRRTCEVRPESSVEKPAKNGRKKSKCFGGDAHQLRRSARRAERSAVLGMHGPKLGAKFRPPATSVRRRRTCEVRPESSVEKPAKNVQDKSKCFGGDAHRMRRSARRAERSAVLGVHGPRLGAKIRPPATSVRRRRTCEVRPESSVENPAKNVQEKSKCFGGDAHQLRRSARRAERSAVLGVHGPRLGAKFRPPATSVRRRRTCEVRPESRVEKPAKNVQDKSKCFGGDAHQMRRSARRAERSAVLGVHGPRLGAKFRPPATSVRRRRTCEVRPESSVEKPAKNGQKESK